MKILLIAIMALGTVATIAQTNAPASTTPKAPAPLLYGNSISLENAKKVAAAAEAYAVGKGWNVVIAIVDIGGNLVLLQKLDNTQVGSLEVAISKARTSNNFKRPTKAFQDALSQGGENMRILSLPSGAIAVEGGELILSDGKIIGAIGVSGVQAFQDTEVAKAGVAAIK